MFERIFRLKLKIYFQLLFLVRETFNNSIFWIFYRFVVCDFNFNCFVLLNLKKKTRYFYLLYNFGLCTD